jgi:hypothetical protein
VVPIFLPKNDLLSAGEILSPQPICKRVFEFPILVKLIGSNFNSLNGNAGDILSPLNPESQKDKKVLKY